MTERWKNFSLSPIKSNENTWILYRKKYKKSCKGKEKTASFPRPWPKEQLSDEFLGFL